VSYRTREQLAAIAGTDRHQGVVARVAAGEYFELDALLETPRERGETPFLLALDQVQDPRNFGAILRTAEAFGAHGVIVGKHHQVGLTGADLVVLADDHTMRKHHQDGLTGAAARVRPTW